MDSLVVVVCLEGGEREGEEEGKEGEEGEQEWGTEGEEVGRGREEVNLGEM